MDPTAQPGPRQPRPDTLVSALCFRQQARHRQTTESWPSGVFTRERRHPEEGLSLASVVFPLPMSGGEALQPTQIWRCIPDFPPRERLDPFPS